MYVIVYANLDCEYIEEEYKDFNEALEHAHKSNDDLCIIYDKLTRIYYYYKADITFIEDSTIKNELCDLSFFKNSEKFNVDCEYKSANSKVKTFHKTMTISNIRKFAKDNDIMYLRISKKYEHNEEGDM